MFKQAYKKAFTLVEVIVVAVIVAILAAVAIPQYQAYVVEQRQQAVTDLAESGAAMANSWVRRKGTNPTVADLNLSFNNSKYEVTIINDSILKVEEKGVSGAKSATQTFK
jgi:type IV pilus assembly protein PilE